MRIYFFHTYCIQFIRGLRNATDFQVVSGQEKVLQFFVQQQYPKTSSKSRKAPTDFSYQSFPLQKIRHHKHQKLPAGYFTVIFWNGLFRESVSLVPLHNIDKKIILPDLYVNAITAKYLQRKLTHIHGMGHGDCAFGRLCHLVYWLAAALLRRLVPGLEYFLALFWCTNSCWILTLFQLLI